MHRDDFHDEDRLDEDAKDLIAGNVQRIKDLIYGRVAGSPRASDPAHGTSGGKGAR